MARVLIASPNPCSNGGGVERFCHLLSDALVEGGHETRLVGPSRSPGRWPMRVALTPALVGRSVSLTAPGWRPDLVITSGFLGAFRRGSSPRVHVFHGTMPGRAFAVRHGVMRRERLRDAVGGGIAEAVASYPAEDRVAVSASAASEARRFFGLQNLRVIENGVDTNLFRPRDRATVRQQLGLAQDASIALFVGRAEPGKAPTVAVAAARAAGYRLLIAGARPVEGGEHIGALTPGELALYYSACDCVLFPTQYEGCSYVVLEALAAGAPVVTTRTGWVRTLLERVPSYESLVAEPTVGAMVAALLRVRDESTFRAADQATAWVRKNNSLERFCGDWRDLVSSILAGSGRRRALLARGAANA